MWCCVFQIAIDLPLQCSTQMISEFRTICVIYLYVGALTASTGHQMLMAENPIKIS